MVSETIRCSGRRHSVPMAVGIPYTSKQTQAPIYAWYLEVMAEWPQGPFEARFEVPVFITDESDPNFHAPRDRKKSRADADALYDRTPTHAGVRVEQRPNGARFYFGPARLPGLSGLFTLFSLIMCGVTAGLYLAGIHPLILLFPGLISIYFISGTLYMWLFISTFRTEPGYLILRKGILGMGPSKRIPVKAIRKVKAERKGGKGGGEASVVYNLVLVCDKKKPVVIAKYVSEKSHALWLADTIRKALDRARKTHV